MGLCAFPVRGGRWFSTKVNTWSHLIKTRTPNQKDRDGRQDNEYYYYSLYFCIQRHWFLCIQITSCHNKIHTKFGKKKKTNLCAVFFSTRHQAQTLDCSVQNQAHGNPAACGGLGPKPSRCDSLKSLKSRGKASTADSSDQLLQINCHPRTAFPTSLIGWL